MAAPLCERHRRQVGKILEGSRRLSESCPAAKGCQGADREPAERGRKYSFLLPRQRRRQPWTAALRRGRVLARRPGVARSQGAGAIGVDLGPWRKIKKIELP